MNPTFSVIVGAYKHSKTIGKLAEALNQQTHQGFEIHLCDDGSPDGTKEIFESKLHPLLKKRYFYHRQEQKGMRLARNINQGISAATGDYCIFIMGDSFPDPEYLEVFNRYTQPHRILCGVRYQVDRDVGVDIDFRLKKQMIPPANVLLPSLPFNEITGNGLCVPTQAMRDHGMWNEALQGYGGDDTELVGRLYYKGYTVWSLADAKLFHHWHKSTESRNIPLVTKLVEQYAGVYELNQEHAGKL